MKTNLRVNLLLIILISLSHCVFSQTRKSKETTQIPTSFTIENSEFEKLFTTKINTAVSIKTNKYLNKSIVTINTAYKENKQLKLKLNYFKNAELFVQINGKDSKIIYILSSDNSVFYNSKIEDSRITLTQCSKDDILSE